MTIKKRISTFLFLLILLVPIFLFAGCESEAEIYLPQEDTGYYLADYDVQIEVDKDRTLFVKETITAHFVTGVSNGIYRYIPLKQAVGYYDENDKYIEKNYEATIDGFSYNNQTTSLYSKFYENGYQFYALKRTGSLDANNEYTFEFGYYYHLPDDRESDYDMIYYNIIGTGWDTSIKNVTFSVTFPDDGGFNENATQFYVGRLGESATTDSRFSYSVNGNVVTGNCVDLKYGEAITIYTDFKEGYFTVEKSYLIECFALIFAIVGVFAFVIFFIKNRRKNDIVEVVEFKAPEGLSPVEAGYIIDGTVTGDDVSALIVYWASKGFLSIEQNGDDNIITKIKDLPVGAKSHQKIFFNELFKRGDSISSKEISSLSPLVGGKVKESVESKEGLYFNTKAKKSTTSMLICQLVALGLVAINVGLESLQMATAILRIVLLVVSFVGGFWHTEICDRRYKYNKGKYWSLWTISWVITLAPLIANIFIGEGYCDAFASRIWGIALVVAILALYPLLERHSQQGKDLMGHLLGLRNFILLAEKDRIEALANENPTAFYDILPFAYVLGVSDVYMEKFKDVPIATPDWLISSNNVGAWFVFVSLNRSMARIGTTIAKTMPNSLSRLGKFAGNVVRSSGGGGGSFGGGGFSGGGHGGGGGGRF